MKLLHLQFYEGAVQLKLKFANQQFMFYSDKQLAGNWDITHFKWSEKKPYHFTIECNWWSYDP